MGFGRRSAKSGSPYCDPHAHRQKGCIGQRHERSRYAVMSAADECVSSVDQSAVPRVRIQRGMWWNA
jgi:hypothetical protein